MTTWRDAPNDEDAVLSQVLYRDDGRPLGMIMRYYEDAPTYAWVRVSSDRFFKRLGACSTDQAARNAGRAGLRGGRFMRARGTPGGR